MEPIGWSKPKRRVVRVRGRDIIYHGLSHLILRTATGLRSRCGVAADTATVAEVPPVHTSEEVCARCSGPYAKAPDARSLRAPKE